MMAMALPNVADVGERRRGGGEEIVKEKGVQPKRSEVDKVLNCRY